MKALAVSLADFLTSGFRPGNPLARRITALFLVKLCVLTTLKLTFFADGHAAGADDLARRLAPVPTVEEDIAR